MGVMATLVRRAHRCWDRLVALSVLDQDGLLYVMAGLLALGILLSAEGSGYKAWAAYREWAEFGLVSYVAGAVVCFVGARRRARRPAGAPAGQDRLRKQVIMALLVTALAIPLGAEVIWRADNHPGDQVQNEVTGIEACAYRVAHHGHCYLAHPTGIGNSFTAGSKDSFFPYLPGMIPFGLVSAISGPAELRDARVPLTGFSLIVIVGSLLVADMSSRRRWRLFQIVVVLPSGALPMVTGGDDLPVIALMMLSLALATRRRPVLSGAAMGLAATLKFTAWPLLFLLALGEWDRQGRRAILRYSMAVLAALVPVLGVGIGSNLHAFVLNAIRFPLGLTKVKSPASSPLIGQELVSLFPGHKALVITLLGAVGAGLVVWALRRWPPASPQAAALFTGLAMALATLLAPATRFGYLIYPLDLCACGLLMRRPAPEPERRPELAMAGSVGVGHLEQT